MSVRRPRGFWVTAPVACFMLLVSSVPPAHSFVLDPPAPSNRIAFNNLLSTTSMSTLGYGETSDAALLERAAALWNQVGVGSRPDHEFFSFLVSPLNADPCAGRDGINTVAFASTECGLAWGDTVGLTLDKWLEWAQSDGSIVISDYETDMLFNDTVPWNAYPGPLLEADTGVPGCCDSTSKLHDFLRVAIHELGHALGLGHPDEHGQTVVSIMSATESTSLHTIQPDDIAGAHAVNFDPTGTPTVGTTVPAPLPNARSLDLSGTLTKFKHKIKTAGEALVLKLTITKVGAPLPDLCILGTVWLSRDASLDPTDQFMTERCINEAITTNTAVKFKLKDLQALGGLFVIVSIDDENVVAETDERNNTIVEQIPQRESLKDTLLVAHDQDGPINAGGILPNARIRIRGAVNAAGDQDVYRLKLKGGQALELTLSHVAATNFDLLVSDGITGTRLGACVTDVVPETCTFTFPSARLIDVTIVPRTSTGTYTLAIVSTTLKGIQPQQLATRLGIVPLPIAAPSGRCQNSSGYGKPLDSFCIEPDRF